MSPAITMLGGDLSCSIWLSEHWPSKAANKRRQMLEPKMATDCDDDDDDDDDDDGDDDNDDNDDYGDDESIEREVRPCSERMLMNQNHIKSSSS
jgi:hypothetical protein